MIEVHFFWHYLSIVAVVTRHEMRIDQKHVTNEESVELLLNIDSKSL